MKYLGDADFLIDYLHGLPAISRLMPGFLAEGLSVSALTPIELYEGAYFSRDPAELFTSWKPSFRAVRHCR